MKKSILVIAVLSFFALTANAQFKINDKIFSTGFTADTVTSISIKVVSLDLQLDSKFQRPVFYLAFNTKSGQSIMGQNIAYDDMKRACIKNAIPENQQETVIDQIFSAVLSGTKTQKLSAIRGMLDAYDIVVKPDIEQ